MTPVPNEPPSAPAAPKKAGPLSFLRGLFRLRVDQSTARVGLVALGFTILFSVIAGAS